MKAELSKRLLIGLVVVGCLLRVGSVAFMDIQQDGNAYAVMGKVLAENGNLIMPWGDGFNMDTEPAPSHHFTPLYPAYLAAHYKVLGFSVEATKVANLNLALLTIAVVFFCTRNLYGSRPAWLVTGIFSVMPRFSMAAGTGFSENAVVLVFTLTLWAGLKGLQDHRFLVLAGFFAGLSYLSRAGMGAFFVIGILMGLAWRLKYQGAKTFKNHYYVLGGVVFMAIVASWAYRNWSLFGSVESSDYLSAITARSWTRPLELSLGLLFKFAQYTLVLAVFYAAFKPEWRQAWKEKAAENVSVLWMSIGIVAVIGVLLAAMIYSMELSPPFWMDSERYLAIAYVPLLWLLFRKESPEPRTIKVRYVALAGLLIVAGVWEIVEPTRSPHDAAAMRLDGILLPGDTIGIQNATVGRYNFYTYLPTYDVREVVCIGNASNPCGDEWPHIIIGLEKVESQRYEFLFQEQTDFILFGSSKPVFVYELKP